MRAAAVEAQGMRVLGVASPLLKCVLPDAPAVDARFQQDVFGSTYTFDNQPGLTERAFEVAEKTGAPDHPRVLVLADRGTRSRSSIAPRRRCAALADRGARARGFVIGLENEHACNVGTGAEAARMLAAVDHPALGLIWDPANASILGETPYPDGYAALPHDRIIHVHAKDCIVHGHAPTWGPLGDMAIDWAGQIDALARDGYRGAISLETHWRGPKGDRLEASSLCGENLRALVDA